MIGAVDIGGTKIAAGVVDDLGTVHAKLECPTEAHLGYENALQRITEMMRAAAQQANTQLLGIGIGSTGPVQPFTGEFGNVDFLRGWEGRNPVADLTRIFNVRVAMENDADAAALGEAKWGAGYNRSCLVYVTVGTGIGGGIILHGKLYRGVDQSHPEIGHHVIDPSGPACSCGFRGCWEALASGPAMEQWVVSNAHGDYAHGPNLTAKRICEFAREGEPLSVAAVKREAHYLGLGLANLINLFTPEAIVLGGSLMKSLDLFFPGIRETIRQGCRFVPWEKTELLPASLGEDANLIGAASVWHFRFGPGAECAS